MIQHNIKKATDSVQYSLEKLFPLSETKELELFT